MRDPRLGYYSEASIGERERVEGFLLLDIIILPAFYQFLFKKMSQEVPPGPELWRNLSIVASRNRL
jgi:hypothetical protein